MTSILLARAQIEGKPLYLLMDEKNRLSLIADNGNRFPINESSTSPITAYQLAEETFNLMPECVVHWIIDVRKKKLECIARQTGKDRDNAYKMLLAKAMIREMEREIKTRDDLKRRIAMQVRYLPLLVKNPEESDRVDIIGTVEDMGLLTPRELAQIFPAEKRYDGEKYQVKDYFTSAEFLNSLEDKPMGTEGALKFMWDYMNPQLMEFNVLVMDAIDNDRKRQGKPTMSEEFAKEMGIPLYTKTTDADGNPILMDEEGNTIPLEGR